MSSISVLLAFYHWSALDETTSEANQTQDDRIRVMEHETSLSVTHSMYDIPTSTYEVNFPEEAEQRNCYLNDEPCKVTDGKVEMEERGNLEFTYLYPKKEDNEALFYIDRLGVELQSEEGTLERNFRVSMASEKNFSNTWASFNPPILESERENINYFEWTFESFEPLVLLQIEELYAHYNHIDGLNIYSTIPIDQQLFEDSKSPFLESQNHLFVIDPDKSETVQENFSLLNTMEKRKIASHLLQSHIISEHQFEESNRWMLDILSDVIFLTEQVNNEQVNAVKNHLLDGLEEHEKGQLIELLYTYDYSNPNMVESMDEILSVLKGYQTSFFSINNNSKSSVPLYGLDQREVEIGEENKRSEWNQVIYRDNSYLPLAEVVDDFDMNLVALNAGNELFIEFEGKRYRFYPNRDMYLIDEERHGLQNNMLVNLNEQIFIESESFSNIFPFEITTSSEKVTIQ